LEAAILERRHLHIHSFIILLTAVLPAVATLRSPASAAAEDQILPLKSRLEKGPDFVLPSADGRPVRLSGYAGHNVLIDFYRGYW